MSETLSGNGFLKFPETFLWGCATSPTQIEGETVNEWADIVAVDGSSANDGSNHWRRYRYDFRCLASMNLRAYRLGFDWARLQPGPKTPLDRDVKLRYMEMLAELRSHSIEPFLTLFHHACPKWFADMGGWLNPESPEIFHDFVRRLAILTDGEVRYWIPLNEPFCYSFLAYIAGVFPPGRRGRLDNYMKAVENMRRAHIMAYDEIHNFYPDASVGVTSLLKKVSAARPWHPFEQICAKAIARVFDYARLDGFVSDKGRKVADFIGINFSGVLRTYGLKALSPMFVKSQTLRKHNVVCDDMWEQDPQWLSVCLEEIYRRYQLPVFVTGHAIATENEGLRVRLLKEHLKKCHQSIDAGVDLRGYFYWSLLDNFEWADGLCRKTGLLAVSFEDPDRRRDIRRTGCIYGEIARQNGFTPEE